MIALRYALTLAKQFDANLTLLHVLEEPYTSDTELEPGAKELPVLKKGNEERELALLEEEMRLEHRNCRSCFRVGIPFSQIAHEAENVAASLIVISSHTYGWLERLLHGSTAEIILRRTLCPVLVIKEPATGQDSEPLETPEPR
jgi:nucleotide-binding universal stress UspA family protein